MIFSYFSISPAAELRLRKKEAEKERVRNRSLKILEEDRIKRYEDSLSIEHIVKGILSDCVEAVVEMLKAPRRIQNPQNDEKNEQKEEQKEKAEQQAKTKIAAQYVQFFAEGGKGRCYKF